MTTALTTYLTTTNSSTLANAKTLVATTGGATGGTQTTLIGTSTGFGEVMSKGNASAWPALGAIGAASGKGYLWDVTTLEGQEILAGNWTPTLRFILGTNTGAITADCYVRAYLYNGSTYTLIGSAMLDSNVSFNVTTTNIVWSATSLPAQEFPTGTKLYVDIWLNILTNSTANAAATVRVMQANSTTQGNIASQIVTPGYVPYSTTTSRAVGRMRNVLSTTKRAVGRLRNAVSTTSRAVGRMRVRVQSTVRATGRLRNALSSTRRATGRLRNAIKTTGRVTGRLRNALKTSSRAVGRMRVRVPWRAAGRMRNALSTTRRAVGRMYNAVTSFTTRRSSGRQYSAIDFDWFTRANQAGLGIGTSGSTYVMSGPATYTWSIASNAGQATGATGVAYALYGNAAMNDGMLLVKWSTSALSSNFGIVARFSDANNHVRFRYANSNITMNSLHSGTSTQVATSAYTITANAWYWMRITCTGSSYQMSVWADGASESTATIISGTNTDNTGGQFGLFANAGATARILKWASLRVDGGFALRQARLRLMGRMEVASPLALRAVGRFLLTTAGGGGKFVTGRMRVRIPWRAVGRMGAAITSTKRAVGRLRNVLSTSRRVVGRVRNAIQTRGRIVGRSRVKTLLPVDDSSYGATVFVGGSLPLVPEQTLLDVINIGPGANLRYQVHWKPMEPNADGNIDWTNMDDCIRRATAKDIHVIWPIQSPPIGYLTIRSGDGATVPAYATACNTTLNATITAGVNTLTMTVVALSGGQSIANGEHINVDDSSSTLSEEVIAVGTYSAGATVVTITNKNGGTWKPAHNHSVGATVVNAGGDYASAAAWLTFTQKVAARYNGTTTNLLTSQAQEALFLPEIQGENEDYDADSNTPRDIQSQWLVPVMKAIYPAIKALHPTCKVGVCAVRRTPTLAVTHITNWLTNLYTYQGGIGKNADFLDFHYYRAGTFNPDPTTSNADVPSIAQELALIKSIAATYGAYPDIYCGEFGSDLYDDGNGVTTTITSTLNAGAPLTSAPVAALSAAIPAGTSLTFDYNNATPQEGYGNNPVYAFGTNAKGAIILQITTDPSAIGQNAWTPAHTHNSGATVYGMTSTALIITPAQDSIYRKAIYDAMRTGGGKKAMNFTLTSTATVHSTPAPPWSSAPKSIVQVVSSVEVYEDAYAMTQTDYAQHGPLWTGVTSTTRRAVGRLNTSGTGAYKRAVGRMRASIKTTSRVVGRLRNVLATTKRAVGRLRNAIASTKRASGRLFFSANTTARITGRMRNALATTRRGAGRTRVALVTTARTVGRLRNALKTTSRTVGRLRNVITATRRLTGRVRLVLTAIQRYSGRMLVEIGHSTTSRATGRMRIVRTTLLRSVGRLRNVLAATKRAVGRIAVRVQGTHRAVGRMGSGLTATKRATGRLRNVLQSTLRQAGRLRISRSSTARSTGRLRLANRAFLRLAGRMQASITTRQRATGRSRVAVVATKRATGRMRSHGQTIRRLMGRMIFLLSIPTARRATGRMGAGSRGKHAAVGRIGVVIITTNAVVVVRSGQATATVRDGTAKILVRSGKATVEVGS